MIAEPIPLSKKFDEMIEPFSPTQHIAEPAHASLEMNSDAMTFPKSPLQEIAPPEFG